MLAPRAGRLPSPVTSRSLPSIEAGFVAVLALAPLAEEEAPLEPLLGPLGGRLQPQRVEAVVAVVAAEAAAERLAAR